MRFLTHFTFLVLLGRIFLALIFILAGLGKISAPEATQEYMALQGLPIELYWPVVGLELIGGIFIAIGYQTRISALLLAGFAILAGLFFHIPSPETDSLSAQNQINHLLKNIAIAGGLLRLAVTGAGPHSIDWRD